jgi:hypothetical protein
MTEVQDGVELDEVEDLTDETEEVETPAEAKKEAKAKPTKKRGNLKDGWATPVALAHKLTELGLGGKDEDGDNLVVPPQVVYSYIKNAPKDHPFPNTHTDSQEPTHPEYDGDHITLTEKGQLNTVKDDIGADRAAFLLDHGVEWWQNKIERAKARKANAAKKASKPAKKNTKLEAVKEAEEDFDEAED